MKSKNTYDRENYLKYRERYLANTKRWADKHREELRQVSAEYYRVNKALVLAKSTIPRATARLKVLNEQLTELDAYYLDRIEKIDILYKKRRANLLVLINKMKRKIESMESIINSANE